MLVSVIITSYNNSPFIDYCIQSVLSQTYQELEIIVYDDGSDDDSTDILAGYKDKISLIAARNFGHGFCFNQINAINQAFEASTGEIVCLLDGDDAFLPDKVQQVVAEFQKDDSIILVQHKLQDIDEENRLIKMHRNEPFRNIDYLRAIYFTRRLDKFFMPTSGLAFRSRYLKQMLPITPDRFDKVNFDVRMTREAPFWGEIRTIPRTLGQYRVHSTSYTATTMSRDHVEQLLRQIYDYFNTVAARHGYPQLRYRPRLLWKIISISRLFIFIIICQERIGRKLRLLCNFTKRIIWRRSILRSYGIQ